MAFEGVFEGLKKAGKKAGKKAKEGFSNVKEQGAKQRRLQKAKRKAFKAAKKKEQEKQRKEAAKGEILQSIEEGKEAARKDQKKPGMFGEGDMLSPGSEEQTEDDEQQDAMELLAGDQTDDTGFGGLL